MKENSKYKIKINLKLSKRHTNTGYQHRYKIKQCGLKSTSVNPQNNCIWLFSIGKSVI